MARKLILFDVDGTLTPSTLQLQKEVKARLSEFFVAHKSDYDFGIVGGSSYDRIMWQLDGFTEYFKWIFSENGLVAHKDHQEIHHSDIRDQVPEKTIQQVINWCLRYIADLDLPCKRGKFIDFRSGLLYITPCGSNVTAEERRKFAEHDGKHQVRRTMLEAMHRELGEATGFDFQLGGQIGLGAHPKGWDKTYCLRHLTDSQYDKIYFIGDRCEPGGNDYPLFSHSGIVGYHTKSPEMTLEFLGDIAHHDKNKTIIEKL